jgi:putative RNA 2'-phosphotransferase
LSHWLVSRHNAPWVPGFRQRLVPIGGGWDGVGGFDSAVTCPPHKANNDPGHGPTSLATTFPGLFSLTELQAVVANNDKARFSFSADGTLIRANQGHSVPVNLGYEPVEPPEYLFHGTAMRFLPAIREQGLVKGRRHHVHLSADVATARQVGGRHGRVVVLKVHTGAMHRDGYAFYLSENGVWLVDAVPPPYLEVVPG